MWTNTCEECGQRYERKGPRTRFCSRKCSQEFQNRQPRPPKRTQGELACAHCGRPFIGQNVSFRTKPKKVYCSRVCYNAVRVKPVPTFVCAWCGGVTERKKNPTSGGYIYQQRFCSKACQNAWQIKPEGGIHKRSGYRLIRDPNGRYREQHRVVMERVLGRALFPYETVHHRDGDRLNNAPENLEVWASRHGRGARLPEAIAWAVQLLTDNGYQVAAP